MNGLAWAALTGWVFIGTFGYGEWQRQVLLTRVAEARGEALAMEDVAQKLLSDGRWVRKYDQKTGASEYRFQAKYAVRK